MVDESEVQFDWDLQESVSIGSGPDERICLRGPGVLSSHALLQRLGRHTALLVLEGGIVYCDGFYFEPGVPRLVDNRPFVIGDYLFRVCA